MDRLSAEALTELAATTLHSLPPGGPPIMTVMTVTQRNDAQTGASPQTRWRRQMRIYRPGPNTLADTYGSCHSSSASMRSTGICRLPALQIRSCPGLGGLHAIACTSDTPIINHAQGYLNTQGSKHCQIIKSQELGQPAACWRSRCRNLAAASRTERVQLQHMCF